jgi:tryptophan-rich sensory protein
MELNLLALLLTIGCCLMSMIIAGKSASKEENKEWFKNLNHPQSLFMLKYMNIAGIAFSLIFGFVLYNLFVSKAIVPIVIAIVIILQMGGSPFLMYKTKNLKLFFFSMLNIPIFVLVLIFFLLQINLISVILLIAYFLYLIYDLSYFYRLMKMNK